MKFFKKKKNRYNSIKKWGSNRNINTSDGNRHKIIAKNFPGVWFYRINDQIPGVYKLTFIQFSSSNQQSAWCELRYLINICRGSEMFICICACWQQGWKVINVHVHIHIKSLQCVIIEAHVHTQTWTCRSTNKGLHISPALQRQTPLLAM